jgi:hypothetical protein
MNGPSDPLEVLHKLNPIQVEELPPASSPEAAALLASILSRRQDVRAGRLWRKRLLVAVAFVLVAGAVAAAAWALTSGGARHETIGCYRSESLKADTAVIPATGGSPAQACHAAWPRAFNEQPPSELQACLLDGGGIAVFPTTDGKTCERLRLRSVSPEEMTSPSAVSVVKVRDALASAFLAQPCMGEKDALALARAELHRLGADDWQVRVRMRFSSSRPCASLNLETDRRIVELVPLPKG